MIDALRHRPGLGADFNRRPTSEHVPPPTAAEKGMLAGILVVAFVLRVALAVLFPNLYHPDEAVQYLEQGHRLAFGYGVIPWEFRDGIRSWSFPGFLAGLMWITDRLGGGAAAYLVVVACVLSAFSVLIVAIAWDWARRLAGPYAGLIAAVVTATWFELVYFGSKALTETPAAVMLFGAAWLLVSGRETTQRMTFLGGLLLGMAFVMRVQLAPAILLVAAVGCFREPIRKGLLVGAGGLVVVAAAGWLDWATWGTPFQSMWKGVTANLLGGKASSYGVLPWYAYVVKYARAWTGFVVPMVAFALYGGRRSPALLLVPLVIFASHSLVAHKEYRFLFPALPFILLAAAVGTADFMTAMRRAWSRVGKGVLLAAVALGWVATSASLAIGDRFARHVRNYASLLAAFSDLRREDALCGIGLVAVNWYGTGGYAYLHRDVPLYVLNPRDGSFDVWRAPWEAFNRVLAPIRMPLPDPRFSRMRCYSGEYCLLGRPGNCVPQPERSINVYLRESPSHELGRFRSD
jgi:GPI mannosyltransferase 3